VALAKDRKSSQHSRKVSFMLVAGERVRVEGDPRVWLLKRLRGSRATVYRRKEGLVLVNTSTLTPVYRTTKVNSPELKTLKVFVTQWGTKGVARLAGVTEAEVLHALAGRPMNYAPNGKLREYLIMSSRR
jgi:hypothetical protein